MLGLSYFFAFWSLSSQVEGLGGSRGLYPAGALLRQVSVDVHRWLQRLQYFPTVLWACYRADDVRTTRITQFPCAYMHGQTIVSWFQARLDLVLVALPRVGMLCSALVMLQSLFIEGAVAPLFSVIPPPVSA